MKRSNGRPKKYPGGYAKCVNISMPENLIPVLDAAAKEEGRTRSDLVAAIIAAHLGESVKYQFFPANAYLS